MMRAASMNILCHVMGDREILSLRWGALHGDTRNALISTPLGIESSPRAFWKAINPQFSDVISKVRLLQLF